MPQPLPSSSALLSARSGLRASCSRAGTSTRTPSDGTGVPTDENCNAVLDDGLAYEFGVPHSLSDVATANIHQWFPRLSPDVLTMYFGGWDRAASGGLAS